MTTVVAVEVVAPEVIGDVKILVAVVVEVLPRRSEGETPVVDVQSDFFGNVDETPALFLDLLRGLFGYFFGYLFRGNVISQEAIGRAVVGVMVDELGAAADG